MARVGFRARAPQIAGRAAYGPHPPAPSPCAREKGGRNPTCAARSDIVAHDPADRHGAGPYALKRSWATPLLPRTGRRGRGMRAMPRPTIRGALTIGP